MASKAADDTSLVPHAVIAQAEAAVLGNIEDNSPLNRQPTHVDTSHPSLSGPQAPLSNDADSATAAPPAYGEHHGELDIRHDGFDTQAKVTDDGRVNININQRSRGLSNLLVPALRSQLSLVAEEEKRPLPDGYIPPELGGLPGQVPPPRLNVVMHVVGSRGDVQPFVALGKTLKSTYRHRVRLATHPVFQSFVEENGLEFYSIGGDPAELMAFMVKNPGLMPGIDSLKSGDVGKRRKGMEEIVLGCWRSCIEAGKGISAIGNYDGRINMDTTASDRPFIADAIIANPPSFAHIHIAEKLGIPLHIMFTMPWSPTQSFPHPLANIQSSNADEKMTNFISYALVEIMTWQGLGDIINRFRERALGLDPISMIWSPGMLTRLRVPFTYCWSPALIPKPKDWAQHITISGFFFLPLASSYTPEPNLAAYLEEGPTPIYIGFGSIVADDPNAMTTLIFKAIKLLGIRALVSKGWGGLGADSLEIPDGVFMLGNVPHDWLFNHVSCTVHHGGAGTTAASITSGKPSVVVPFFGDQPFWGAMVAKARAGPVPIPYKHLTAEKLAAAIAEALKPATLERAKELGAKIAEEKGTEVGGKAFHDHLDMENLRCSLDPSRVAVWQVKKTKVRLSALAAAVLSAEGLINFADLQLYRSREYDLDEGPWDPISGGASALLGTIASLTMGVADIPHEIYRGFNRKVKDHERHSSASGSEGPAPRSDPQIDLLGDTTSSSRADRASSPAQTPIESTRRPVELSQAGPLSSGSTINSLVHRGTSLRDALKEHKHSRSRSGSPSRFKREIEPSDLTLDSLVGAGKGFSRIVGAGLKSPMDFTLGLARGFHNAPKLYGDDTIRPQERVVDFQSGLKAAGKEFGYGFYDGISGLITQPMRGAEKDGAAGVIKGIGRGIGGLVLKPGAAIWGLPGYTFLGIHKEIRKMFGGSIQNYIISARTAKGFEEFQASTVEDRQAIVTKWRFVGAEYQTTKQKAAAKSDHTSPKGFLQTRHLTFDERKKLHAERKAKAAEERVKTSKTVNTTNLDDSATNSKAGSETRAASHGTPDVSDELENAIQRAVAATSVGDSAQDAVIERAIRASIAEPQRPTPLTDEEAMDRAIKASIAESTRSTSLADSGHTLPTAEEEEKEHQALLEKSLQLSLQESRTPRIVVDVDSEDDDDIKRAIEESKKPSHRGRAASVELSEEERVALEYVKKQSLAEEAHKTAMKDKENDARGASRDEDDGDDDDDDDLKRAIEESMRSGK